MACGLPVVVTDLPGVRKVAESGIIVEPKNSGALTKGIVKLLKDARLRTKIAQNGLKTVHVKYSWGTVAHVLEKRMMK